MTKHLALLSLISISILTSCDENLELVAHHKEVFYSSVADDDYKLYIVLPKDYSVDNSYPVVYYLDGDWYHEFFRKEIDALVESEKIPPCIVVGIGYPLDGGYKEVCPKCKFKEDEILINRVRDYTFPDDETFQIPTGGAPLFTQFLNEDLIPKIETDYSTDPARYYLMGHSMGGLGVFYNIFHSENSRFHGFAALSSSIWWQNGHTFSLEEEYFENNTDLEKKIYIAYGTAESGSLAAHNAEMIDRIKGRNYPSIEMKSKTFKGASHRQVSWDGFRAGLIFLLNN